MHQWIVFGHILGALLFMLAHGASAAVVFRLRRERDPGAVRVLLNLSGMTIPFLYLGLLLLIGAGLWAGMSGPWFRIGALWLWVSIVLLVVILGAMYGLLTPAFKRLRETVGDGSAPVDQGALDRALAAPGPMMGAGIGLVGVLLILWLMVLKPF
ncbi:MAG: DUF2269 family protein [Candidatus Limnocylindrales bacterium]